MEAVFCRWGFAKKDNGKRGFCITLIALSGHHLTYVFDEEIEKHLEDLEELKNSIAEFLKIVKGEADLGYA